MIHAASKAQKVDLTKAADAIITFLSWLTAILILLACSQRFTSRYEIYFFMPLLLLSAWTASKENPQEVASTHWPAPGKELLSKFFAYSLIATSLIASSANAANLKSFVNPGQPRSFVCFGHHMDRSMGLTSAAKCENFQEATLDKDKYNSWHGPK
jgi:hypothetical protein